MVSDNNKFKLEVNINFDELRSLISSLSQIGKSFYEAIKGISDNINRIDWAGLGEKLKNFEKHLSEFEDDCWAIDEDMPLYLISSGYESNVIEKYVEEHLEEYIDFFRSNTLYSRHSSLLEETYEVYKLGYYKHCTLPLLAAFENILEVKFEDYTHSKDDKLYYKVKNYANSTDHYFIFRHVINVYLKLFKSYRTHPGQLNRHWLAHGKYDYNKIKKSDVLKLFQLLKAAEILNDISFEEAAEDEKINQ